MEPPRPAPVRPRVYTKDGGGPFLLEDEIRALLEAQATGAVAVTGGPGAGKTTALAHLAAVLPAAASVVYLDRPAPDEVLEHIGSRLVVYASTRPFEAAVLAIPHRAIFELVPWDKDDLIEYLLAVHPDRCASVMQRISADDLAFLDGTPRLWHIVLNEMAWDQKLPSARRALRRHITVALWDPEVRERALDFGLRTILMTQPLAWIAAVSVVHAQPHQIATLIDELDVVPEVKPLLRHQPVVSLLAAEKLVTDIGRRAMADWVNVRVPRDVIQGAASLLADDAAAPAYLEKLMADITLSAMTASLLHALDPDWQPVPRARTDLRGAFISGVHWAGINLDFANLLETDFEDANLEGASLCEVEAGRARFARACMRRVKISKLRADGANFSHADLTGVRGQMLLVGANLEGAILEDTALRESSFREADLRGINFRRADLTRCRLSDARIDDADFTGACLVKADLSRLRLRLARFQDADFTAANLEGCDLEGMELPSAHFATADLTDALLTGSYMPDADFSGACLRNAGLAEISWERANLRGADLRGVSFHLGSTRSGRVGSPIASEGSRTGFYTDEFEEQVYKAPEEIRKANLCGADLRGAKIDDVDFYLVDLRGAKFDPEHEAHLRRCGAILGTRV